MTTHRIDLPWTRVPITQNQARRMHHMVEAKVKREAAAMARAAIRSANLPRLAGAEVWLHLRPGTRRRMDGDGICPALKVVLDALVAEDVLTDDSWVEVPRSGHEVHPPEPGEPAAMWVTVTELGRRP